MKRVAKCTRKLRTWLRKVIRDIERKCVSPDKELKKALEKDLQAAKDRQAEDVQFP